MALYEKRNKMPPHLAEIPYGFKNLWRITVTKYNAATQSFNVADIRNVLLNGSSATASQLAYLFDYNRDGCGLTVSDDNAGIYVTLTGYDRDPGTFTFDTIVAPNLEFIGVMEVEGDMVDSSNPNAPIINHDTQKLDVAQYEEDQAALDTRLDGMVSSITTSGEGNVITDISPEGAAQKGTVVSVISVEGDGNVITGASQDGETVTLERGTMLADVEQSDEGDIVVDVNTTGDGIVRVTKSALLGLLPQASATTPGIVQLYGGLDSTSETQALTASAGKTLADMIAENDALYVKLTGEQTIHGVKTFESDPITPAKSILPASPSESHYATEAQVATRVSKPAEAVINNLAAFDSDKNIVDSGISNSAIVPNTRMINGKALDQDITLLAEDVGAIGVGEKGQPLGLATLNADGDTLQNPASYGKPLGGATLDALGRVIQGLAPGMANPSWISGTLINGATGSLYYCKVGVTAYLSGAIKPNSTTTGLQVFTIPTSYRPSMTVPAIGYPAGTSSITAVAQFSCSTNGVFGFRGAIPSATETYSFTMSYLAEN